MDYQLIEVVKMPNQRLSPEILTAALTGLEIEKRRLEESIAEVRAMLGGRRSADGGAAEVKHHRSAAARRKMAQAQKARWARERGKAAKPAAKKAPVKKKVRLSAAGRAAIVDALKKRWAAKKAAAKKSPAVVKKAAAAE